MEKQQKISTLMSVAKTSLWLIAFIALGSILAGPLFKGKSQNPAETEGAGDNVFPIGKDNPRVKELSQEYLSITWDRRLFSIYRTKAKAASTARSFIE
jgi:hypothetical protein